MMAALLLLASAPAGPAALPVPPAEKAPPACRQSSRPPPDPNAQGNYPQSYNAANQVEQQIDRFAECLAQPDVQSAYGADDQWDEVDRRSGEPGAGKPRKKKGGPVRSIEGAAPRP